MPPLSLDSAKATVISNKEVAARYEALIRLAKRIRSRPEERDLFEICVSELRQLVAFDGINLFDPAANRIQRHFIEPYSSKVEALPLKALSKEQTVAWSVSHNQEPVVIRSVEGETRFPHVLPRLISVGLRSVCAVPLSTAHRQLGSLIFSSHIEDAYSTEDQRFLSLVADQIAVAMDDARAQQRLRLLLELTNRFVSKLDWHELLLEISANIRWRPPTLRC